MNIIKKSMIAAVMISLGGSACASDKNTKDFQETEKITYEHEEHIGEDYSRTAYSDVETDVDEDSVEVEVERTEVVERPHGQKDYVMKQRIEVEADDGEIDTEQSMDVEMKEIKPDEEVAVVAIKRKAPRMVHFPYDKATLDARDKKILRQRAKWLKRNPDAQIVIEGHADERGGQKYNFDLARERAQNVAKYLSSLGVDTDRLQIVSRGENEPLLEADTQGAYLLNRRVEFERASAN